MIKDFGLSYNDVMYNIPYDTLIMLSFTDNERHKDKDTETKKINRKPKEAVTVTTNENGYPQMNIF